MMPNRAIDSDAMRAMRRALARARHRDRYPSLNKRSAVPRHTEINDHLARKICKDLSVPQP